MLKKYFFLEKNHENVLGSLVNWDVFGLKVNTCREKKSVLKVCVFVLECGVPAAPRTASHQRKWCKRSKVRWQGQG